MSILILINSIDTYFCISTKAWNSILTRPDFLHLKTILLAISKLWRPNLGPKVKKLSCNFVRTNFVRTILLPDVIYIVSKKRSSAKYSLNWKRRKCGGLAQKQNFWNVLDTMLRLWCPWYWHLKLNIYHRVVRWK